MTEWPEAVIKMQEPNKFEIQGMYAASEKGGAFLDTIGKTDLAQLSEDQWMQFIETIVRSYEEMCMSLYSPNGEPPFPPVE
jgi:hypothetical protein